MATVMSWQSSGGRKGRCDARCHGAKHTNCTCICGGKNHGVGGQQALENTANYVDGMVEALEDKIGEDVAAYCHDMSNAMREQAKQPAPTFYGKAKPPKRWHRWHKRRVKRLFSQISLVS